jgi:hypothetical protein
MIDGSGIVEKNLSGRIRRMQENCFLVDETNKQESVETMGAEC